MVNTCQPHRVRIVALQVKYLLCAKATTRECVGRVAGREKLLARKLPVLQYLLRVNYYFPPGEDVHANIRMLFTDAVRKRLMAHRPLAIGCLLSGKLLKHQYKIFIHLPCCQQLFYHCAFTAVHAIYWMYSFWDRIHIFFDLVCFVHE